VIVPEEARTVCLIYKKYRELGSVRVHQQHLDKEGIRSKVRTYRDGRVAGGRLFSRGALYALLSNHVYIGEINHKGIHHPGLREPIIERPLWKTVAQARAPAAHFWARSLTRPGIG
jgi:site-specific DNA recombinase